MQVIYRWAFAVAPALCLSLPPPTLKRGGARAPPQYMALAPLGTCPEVIMNNYDWVAVYTHVALFTCGQINECLWKSSIINQFQCSYRHVLTPPLVLLLQKVSVLSIVAADACMQKVNHWVRGNNNDSDSRLSIKRNYRGDSSLIFRARAQSRYWKTTESNLCLRWRRRYPIVFCLFHFPT